LWDLYGQFLPFRFWPSQVASFGNTAGRGDFRLKKSLCATRQNALALVFATLYGSMGYRRLYAPALISTLNNWSVSTREE
jgi:hypothetical protein